MTATILVFSRTWFWAEPVSPLANPTISESLRKRHDVTADIAVGDQRAQKRAGIVG